MTKKIKMCHVWGKYSALLFCSLLSLTKLSYAATEQIVWDKKPLEIFLPIAKERMLVFPCSVTFINQKINKENPLTSKDIEIINNNAVIYLRAKRPFSKKRVAVKINKTGEHILLDLFSKENAGNEPLQITLVEKNKETTFKDKSKQKPWSYAALNKFALSWFFPDAKPTKYPENIRPAAVPMVYTASLFADKKTNAMPIASWTDGYRHVSVVHLRNMSTETLVLKEKDIKGPWLTISFFPYKELEALGKDKDNTLLLLVSEKSFSNGLLASAEQPQNVSSKNLKKDKGSSKTKSKTSAKKRKKAVVKSRKSEATGIRTQELT